MTLYLIKVSACIALFYVVYLVFFRQTNLHQLNRFYLLMGIVAAFVIPLIVLPAQHLGVISLTTLSGYAMDDLQLSDVRVQVQTHHSIISYLYLLGATVSFCMTALSVRRVLRLYQAAGKFTQDGHRVAVHPGIQPFSFLAIMFVRSRDEDAVIVEHELVHVRQRHWIDLLVVEIASIVLWFNPILYFYRRSMAIQHEYIADRLVTSHIPVATYLSCIARQLELNMQSGLVNNFNTQSIKQRIMMITNTNVYSRKRYLIVLPVLAAIVMAFATHKTTYITMQNKEFRAPVDMNKLKPGEGAGFGKKINPATNREVMHTGMDFVLEAGNDVFATADGVVVSARMSDSHGNRIIIEHDGKLRSSSSHLERILVKEGERVKAGQVIGTVGSTGLSQRPHLHFEITKDGVALDPMPYLNVSDK